MYIPENRVDICTMGQLNMALVDQMQPHVVAEEAEAASEEGAEIKFPTAPLVRLKRENTLLSVLSSKPRPTKKARKVKVRFSSKVSYQRHQQLQDGDNKAHCWLQAQDYFYIKVDILNSIETLTKFFSNTKDNSSCPMVNLSEHCLRGIETGISAELSKHRKERIAQVTRNVLEQQQRQRLLGIFDPQALRQASLLATKNAQQSAAAVGQLDSKEI